MPDLFALQNQANQKIFARMREEGVDREALGKELAKNDEILVAEIEQVMTPEQKTKFEEMKGPKFEASEQQQTFTFGRGGRGGRGGGGG